jgi:hypothetical protein
VCRLPTWLALSGHRLEFDADVLTLRRWDGSLLAIFSAHRNQGGVSAHRVALGAAEETKHRTPMGSARAPCNKKK